MSGTAQVQVKTCFACESDEAKCQWLAEFAHPEVIFTQALHMGHQDMVSAVIHFGSGSRYTFCLTTAYRFNEGGDNQFEGGPAAITNTCCRVWDRFRERAGPKSFVCCMLQGSDGL
jgi:hypothetical protein